MILTGSETRVLVTNPYGQEILKARLAAASQAHHLAARTLLEAVALFCNARVRVVLSAESEESSCAQGLSDGFGFGIDSLYYEVEIAPAGPRPGLQARPGPAPPMRRPPLDAPKVQEAAHVFRLLDQGLSLRKIVTQAGVPPHRVRSLHREWTRSLEQGPPQDDHALGDGAELDALAAVAEDLFAREG
jgi:hypothetical protein